MSETTSKTSPPRGWLPLASLLLASVLVAEGEPAQGSGELDIQAAELEKRIYADINREREAKNVPRLQLDAGLSRIARAHSADMLHRSFFSHVNPDGDGPSDRGRKTGFECKRREGRRVMQGLAENIYRTNSYDRVTIRNGVASYEWKTAAEIAVSIVGGWMKSRGHRKNILEFGVSRTGIGVAVSPDGKVLVSQIFC